MAERDLVRTSGAVSWKPISYFFTIMSFLLVLSWFFTLQQSSDRRNFLDRTSSTLSASQEFIPIGTVRPETNSQAEIDPSVKNRSILNDKEEESENSEETGTLVPREAGRVECPPENRTILKVYMYNLAPEFHFELLDWKAQGGNGNGNGNGMWPDLQAKVPSYPGGLNLQHSIEYWLILDLLSSESANSTEGRSAVRVLNSSEADVMFVPFFSSLCYNRFSKVKPRQKRSTNVLLQDKLVRFLMSREEWIRSGGKDHVVPAHHPNSMLRARTKLWPAMFILSDFGRYPPNVANIDKDIIAPYKHVIKNFVGDESGFETRPTLLYFQGAIQRKAGGFIRHELYNLLKNEKDVHFSFGSVQRDGIRKATQGMHTSKFCLNIAGDTPSSNRLFDAIASHCVPVIISDEIELPYEDVLDYSKFCIFVRTSDALKKNFLIKYIRAIGKEDWTRMWERLKEVERFYEFQYPSREGDAVQMIWQAIARKVPAMRRKLHKSKRFYHPVGRAELKPTRSRHDFL